VVERFFITDEFAWSYTGRVMDDEDIAEEKIDRPK